MTDVVALASLLYVVYKFIFKQCTSVSGIVSSSVGVVRRYVCATALFVLFCPTFHCLCMSAYLNNFLVDGSWV